MPIHLTCVHCGQQISVPDEFAGRSGRCARCGKAMTIPAASVASPPSSGARFPTRLVVAVAVGVVVVFAVLLAVQLPADRDGGGTARRDSAAQEVGEDVSAAVLPAVQAAREAARRAQCSNHLKMIGLALHNYHDVYKSFPPAVVTDRRGAAIRSWRVAILPFLGHPELYVKCDFKQPWDSPRNATLGQTAIDEYHCPSDSSAKPAETNYVIVVGDGTFGGKPNEAISLRDITDGTSNTIAIVEVTGMHIAWNEPKDITVDELISLVAARKVSRHPGGFQSLMADGSAQFIPYTIERENLRRLLIRNDGKAVAPF